MIFEINPLKVVSTGVYAGVYYGGKIRILVEDDSLALAWMSGATVYVDRSVGSAYATSSLRLCAKNSNRRGQARDARITSYAEELHEGGRISKQLLMLPEIQKRIIGIWGHDVAAAISPKYTITIK